MSEAPRVPPPAGAHPRRRRRFAAALLALLAPLRATAQPGESAASATTPTAAELKQLPIEMLLDVEVTSATKRPQALADWITKADRPQVFLWALDNQVLDHGAPISPSKLQLVRIWAGDELSAVRDLRLRVLPSPTGGHLLEMLATDLVGNATTVTWPLAH